MYDCMFEGGANNSTTLSVFLVWGAIASRKQTQSIIFRRGEDPRITKLIKRNANV